VRWKNPGESERVLREYGIGGESVKDSLNDDALFAAAIIETAMLLHNSRYKGNASLENVLALLGDMQEKDFYQAEFEQLIRELRGN
jgi:Ca-activated chloride channel family protein